jgi:hypothetical protein
MWMYKKALQTVQARANYTYIAYKVTESANNIKNRNKTNKSRKKYACFINQQLLAAILGDLQYTYVYNHSW